MQLPLPLQGLLLAVDAAQAVAQPGLTVQRRHADSHREVLLIGRIKAKPAHHLHLLILGRPIGLFQLSDSLFGLLSGKEENVIPVGHAVKVDKQVRPQLPP